MPDREDLSRALDERRQNTQETRSKRMQILVTPSMFENLKERAGSEGVSVNELVNVIFDLYLKR
jgi:predicted HicB family RNase H-like nuclease